MTELIGAGSKRWRLHVKTRDDTKIVERPLVALLGAGGAGNQHTPYGIGHHHRCSLQLDIIIRKREKATAVLYYRPTPENSSELFKTCETREALSRTWRTFVVSSAVGGKQYGR